MHGFKISKDRLTLLLGPNAVGGMKLKRMLIDLSENLWVLKNYANLLCLCSINGTKKAHLFTTCLAKYFKPTVEIFSERKFFSKYYRSLTMHLVIQDLQWRWTMRLMLFSGLLNTTSILQSMDQGVILTFKSLFKKHIL